MSKPEFWDGDDAQEVIFAKEFLLQRRISRALRIPDRSPTPVLDWNNDVAKQPISLLDFNNQFSFSGGGIRTYHLRKLEHFANRDDVQYSLVVPSDRDLIESLHIKQLSY